MPDNTTRYEVFRSPERSGEDVQLVWRWRGVAAENGEILSSGQGYSRRIDAVRMIEGRFLRDGDELVILEDLHQTTGPVAAMRYELLHDAVGEPDDEDAKGLDCA